MSSTAKTRQPVVRNSFTGATVRVITSSAPTTTYGVQANQMLILRWVMSSSSGSRLPIQDGDQRSRGGKSQTSVGIRKPRLDANITITSPIRPPSRDGNSGPSTAATMT